MARTLQHIVDDLKHALPALGLSAMALAVLLVLIGTRPGRPDARTDAPAAPPAPTPTVKPAVGTPVDASPSPASAQPSDASATLVGAGPLGIKASALVALPGGGFVGVDDDVGVQVADGRGGSPQTVHPAGEVDGFKDLEGLCLGEDTRTLYVVAERTGLVFTLALTADGAGVSSKPPALFGRLPDIGKDANKGWEGLSVLPSTQAADKRAHLVAVHEGKPRRVALFTLPELRTEVIWPLPPPLEERMDDLSDVAVRPGTAEIFLLSDQSAYLARVRIDGGSLVVLGGQALPVTHKEKPEALAFEGRDVVVVGADKSARLYRFRLAP